MPANTRSSHTILLDARARDLIAAYHDLWSRFLTVYEPDATKVQAIHPTFIPDFYPWFKSARMVALKLNTTLTAHGYDLPVRVFLGDIMKLHLGNGMPGYITGPRIIIDGVRDLLMVKQDEDALLALSDFLTNLHNLGRWVEPYDDSTVSSLGLVVLQQDAYKQVFERVALFLRENER